MPVVYPNPIAQVPFQVAKGVRKNQGVLRYRHKVTNMLNGRVTEYVFERQVWLLDIDLVDEWLIKQGEFKSGDMRAYVPALSLYNARRKVQDNDPDVVVSGQHLTLADIRNWSNKTAGIVIGNSNDSVVWNESEYFIVKIEPKDFWNNAPGKFRLYLRK